MSAPDLDAIASLAEPTRAALYDYVVASAAPVGRDDAASACGIPDKLRPTTSTGWRMTVFSISSPAAHRAKRPGSGPASKAIPTSPQSFSMTVPPRRYELAAKIMLEALATDSAARSPTLRTGWASTSGARGVNRSPPRNRIRTGRGRLRDPVPQLPVPLGSRSRTRDTICGMNLALVEGMVEGAGEKDLRPGGRTRRRLLLRTTSFMEPGAGNHPTLKVLQPRQKRDAEGGETSCVAELP